MRRIAETYHRTTVAYEGQSQRAEEASSLYKLITENSVDLISLIDASGRYTYVSPSFQRVLGYEPDDLLGKTVSSFIEPAGDLANWEHLFATGLGQELIRHKKAQGVGVH